MFTHLSCDLYLGGGVFEFSREKLNYLREEVHPLHTTPQNVGFLIFTYLIKLYINELSLSLNTILISVILINPNCIVYIVLTIFFTVYNKNNVKCKVVKTLAQIIILAMLLYFQKHTVRIRIVNITWHQIHNSTSQLLQPL